MPYPEHVNPEQQPSTVEDYLFAFAKRIYEADAGTQDLEHAWRSLVIGILMTQLYDPKTGERQHGASAETLNRSLTEVLRAGFESASSNVTKAEFKWSLESITSISISDWDEWMSEVSPRIVHPGKSSTTSPIDVLAGLYKGTTHYDDLMGDFEDRLFSSDSR